MDLYLEVLNGGGTGLRRKGGGISHVNLRNAHGICLCHHEMSHKGNQYFYKN